MARTPAPRITLNERPSTRLQLSVSPSLTRSHNHTRYVSSLIDPAATGTSGRVTSSPSWSSTPWRSTRVDWTLTSKVSFQLYMQPFVASGLNHDHHALAFARTAALVPYAGAIPNNDFNFRSVRATAVARCSLRPGSAIYVVWNENRSGHAPHRRLPLRPRSEKDRHRPVARRVLLIKVSYWWPL